jgi:integral membrane sensor domain MASE1
MRTALLFLLKVLIFAPIVAAIVGWVVAPWFLHPVRRPLTPDLVRDADVTFS